MVLNRRRLWVWSRRAVQLGCLALFLGMFRATEYVGGQELGDQLNLWFRLDPLLAAAASLAAKTLILALAPALVLVALTFLLGRFFCGWVCPLGTLLDGFARLIRQPARWTRRRLRLTSLGLQRLKHVLLAVVLFSALGNVMLVGYVDPLTILFRGLATAVDPLLAGGADHNSAYLNDHAPDWVAAISEPTYDFMADHLLPFQRASLAGLWVGGVPLLVIFLLDFADRRFWCRNLCPLGGLLGLIGRWSLLRRRPMKACAHCHQCRDHCRMGAFDRESRFQPEACNLCMDCVSDCPDGIAAVGFQRTRAKPAPFQLTRRTLLEAGLTGLLVPLGIGAMAATGVSPNKRHLRPPGAGDDAQFLDRCVRCGECLKVCPTNALQPQLLESGFEGLFAPVLAPRKGYCEYHCTLCGQVCPTGAIPLLNQTQKVKTVLGLAHIDTDRCLPWATNESCVGCEEMCPVPEKAITTEAVVCEVRGQRFTVMRPKVHASRCIGCGICEYNCPVEGSAIHVLPREEGDACGKHTGSGRQSHRRRGRPDERVRPRTPRARRSGALRRT